jgi:hypothetical protein
VMLSAAALSMSSRTGSKIRAFDAHPKYAATPAVAVGGAKTAWAAPLQSRAGGPHAGRRETGQAPARKRNRPGAVNPNNPDELIGARR